MFAGVQDEQQLPRPQRLREGLRQRQVGFLTDAERGRHPPGDQAGVSRIGQFDQPGAVRIIRHKLAREPQGQPGLADAARNRTASAHGPRRA